MIDTISRESKINPGRSLKVVPPDFGLSTISALLCSAISTGTSLLYSEEKSSGIMWRKETTTKRPCSNTITDAPQLTVKATAEDGVRGGVVQVAGASLDSHISPASDTPH